MSKLPFTLLSKEQVVPRVSAFIYGLPGAGKTYLARSLVENENLFPALIVVCDAGELTLRDLIDDTNFVVIHGDFKSLTTVYEYLSGRNSHGFKSVFIDNLTELHRQALLERARITSTNKSRSEYEFTQNDYGISRNQILSVVAAFATMLPNISVFATALANPVLDERTGRALLMPALPGKLAVEVPGYFDLVACLEVEAPKAADYKRAERANEDIPQPERVLVVNQKPDIPVARNRGGKFTQDIINPTLSDIYEKMSRQGD